MMRRSHDRILTTHVGSLVRPAELLQLAAETRDRPLERYRYVDALQEATARVVAQQAEAGIDIVNDGEYGKSSWANYLLDRMTGFETRPGTKMPMYWLGRDRERFPEAVENEFRNMLGTIQQ